MKAKQLACIPVLPAIPYVIMGLTLTYWGAPLPVSRPGTTSVQARPQVAGIMGRYEHLLMDYGRDRPSTVPVKCSGSYSESESASDSESESFDRRGRSAGPAVQTGWESELEGSPPDSEPDSRPHRRSGLGEAAPGHLGLGRTGMGRLPSSKATGSEGQ
jgi:hypothetical protein